MIKKAVIFTIAIVSLLCPQVSANQTNVSSVKDSIVKHSIELGVDPALALSIAKSESGFRHEARSSHGAVGVFQLMPSTARKLGVNPYYLSDNIRGGLIYYKKLYNMFGSTELALAAYNAGPGAVKRYKSVPPIRETKRFVSKIMTEYDYQKSYPDPAIVRRKTQNTIKIQKKSSPKAVDVSRPVIMEKNLPKVMALSHPVKFKTVSKKPPVPTAMIPAQGVI